MEITGEVEEFSTCVLRLRECSNDNPCPVHSQIVVMRKNWQHISFKDNHWGFAGKRES